MALQTAVQKDRVLASASTQCRIEKRADREQAVRLHEVLVEQFIDSYKRPPRRLILEFHATDDRVHGQQVGRFYHGYYDAYCFLPLYVFCGDRLLVSYLRPSKIDGAKHVWAVLALLVKRLRRAWPKVKIVFRGDSGLCRWRMLCWCERNNVGYIVGFDRNKRLNALSKPLRNQALRAYEDSGDKQHLFDEFFYAAGSWEKRRWVIVKAEYTARGSNPHYICDQLVGLAAALVLRPVLLSRRHGKPDQGSTAASVRRPH